MFNILGYHKIQFIIICFNLARYVFSINFCDFNIMENNESSDFEAANNFVACVHTLLAIVNESQSHWKIKSARRLKILTFLLHKSANTYQIYSNSMSTKSTFKLKFLLSKILKTEKLSLWLPRSGHSNSAHVFRTPCKVRCFIKTEAIVIYTYLKKLSLSVGSK